MTNNPPIDLLSIATWECDLAESVLRTYDIMQANVISKEAYARAVVDMIWATDDLHRVYALIRELQTPCVLASQFSP